MSLKKSKVWLYFDINESDETKANCKLCNEIISRGGKGKAASTSPLILHLKRHHEDEYNKYQGNKTENQKIILTEEVRTKTKLQQITLQQLQTKNKPWDNNDQRAKKITFKIAEMICLDNQPYSIVENIGFSRLISTIVPQYTLPSRNYIKNIISDIYGLLRTQIARKLSKMQYISLTSDIWTCSKNNNSFISITGHWISNEWERENVVLSCESFPGSHTGLAVATKILDITKVWNIQISQINIILRDNGTNMIKGCNDAKIHSESCFIHTLQLVITDAISLQRAISDMIACARKIVTHFNHSSVACDKLKIIQNDLNMTQRKVVQDVSTRWNSTYYMLQRLHELKRCIIIYLLENNAALNLTTNQWNLLETTINILKPFEEITKQISSTNSLISDVIPSVATLQKYFLINKFSGAGILVQNLTEGLENRFRDIYEKNSFVNATLLDPRYKMSFFPERLKSTAKYSILREMTKLCIEVPSNNSSSNDSDSDNEPLAKKKKKLSTNEPVPLWQCYNDIIGTACSSSNQANEEQTASKSENKFLQQINAFLNLPIVDRSSDPIIWWKDHGRLYPELSSVAQKYLSSPASSVYSERTFSEIGIIYEERRSRLTPVNAEKLLFIHHNLQKCNFEY